MFNKVGVCFFCSQLLFLAWEIAPNGLYPMHSCFREFPKCMGNSPKGPDSHAFLLPRVSYMHGEWPQMARFPCILASASFLYAWGMAPNSQYPMHSRFREFLICMGNGPKWPDSHAKKEVSFKSKQSQPRSKLPAETVSLPSPRKASRPAFGVTVCTRLSPRFRLNN